MTRLFDRLFARAALGASLTALLCTSAMAAANATREEATAMVKKTVATIKTGSADKVYAGITVKQPAYVDRDLYIVVYGLDGTVLAHGANEKMVGRNLIALKDVDGKPFVKERVDMGKAQASFWQDYKFINPTSRKIEPKQMYCERLEQTVVCGGVYK